MRNIKKIINKEFDEKFKNNLDFSEIAGEINYQPIETKTKFARKAYFGGLVTGCLAVLVIVLIIGGIKQGTKKDSVEQNNEYLSYQTSLTKTETELKENELLANFAYSNGFTYQNTSNKEAVCTNYVINIYFNKTNGKTYQEYVSKYDPTPFNDIAEKLNIKDIKHYLKYQETSGIISIVYDSADKLIISQYMIEILSIIELPYIEKLDFMIYQVRIGEAK